MTSKPDSSFDGCEITERPESGWRSIREGGIGSGYSLDCGFQYSARALEQIPKLLPIAHKEHHDK